jgi:hypothetical protein
MQRVSYVHPDGAEAGELRAVRVEQIRDDEGASQRTSYHCVVTIPLPGGAFLECHFPPKVNGLVFADGDRRVESLEGIEAALKDQGVEAVLKDSGECEVHILGVVVKLEKGEGRHGEKLSIASGGTDIMTGVSQHEVVIERRTNGNYGWRYGRALGKPVDEQIEDGIHETVYGTANTSNFGALQAGPLGDVLVEGGLSSLSRIRTLCMPDGTIAERQNGNGLRIYPRWPMMDVSISSGQIEERDLSSSAPAEHKIEVLRPEELEGLVGRIINSWTQQGDAGGGYSISGAQPPGPVH